MGLSRFFGTALAIGCGMTIACAEGIVFEYDYGASHLLVTLDERDYLGCGRALH
jgi:hypothetical protein